MKEQQYKQMYRKTFNIIAEGYDNPNMWFFDDSANYIASLLNLEGHERVLDVATGTGNVAIALATKLPEGHVIGIDFSEGMLSQAKRKMNDIRAKNIEFIEMDMQSIEFPDKSFDVAVCAYSIFFVEDIRKQLVHIASKIKEGGTILVSTFFEKSFSPLVDLFFKRLEIYGIEPPNLVWKRIATQNQCVSLFKDVGLCDITCECVKDGQNLRNASVWWYIVMNGGFRGLINKLSMDDFEKFKEEHLAEVMELATEKGIWMDMSYLHTIGKKNY